MNNVSVTRVDKRIGAVVLAFLVFTSLSATLSRGAQAGEFAFGYIPLSEAEFLSQPEVPRYRSFLPAKVDLSHYFPLPGAQGRMNSCTGWAVGYAARSYYSLRVEGKSLQKIDNIASPNYIYQSIRKPENCASGARLLDSFRLLQTGSLSYQQFSNESCQQPSVDQRKMANRFKIRDWLAVRPQVIDDVKGQIARGSPVVIGMAVGEEFKSLERDEVYRGSTKKLGFHAMVVVGYDDQKQAFKVLNSWGRDWASNGFGLIDYATFRSDVHEAYIMRMDAALKPTSEESVAVKPGAPVAKKETVEVVSPRIVVKPKPRPDRQDQVQIVVAPFEAPIRDSDCSNVVYERKGERVELSGYVPTAEDVEIIQRSNEGKPVDLRLDVRPWPQCEVLATLEPLLNKSGGPEIRTKGARTSYSDGEQLIFNVVTPKRPSYVYVSYVQSDGIVNNLWQPESDLSPAKSGQVLTFGDGQRSMPRLTVRAPYGRESLLAVVSDSPLFEEPLPRQMTEREYLSSLRRALLYRADPLMPSRNVSAAFLGLETRK